MTQSTQYQFVIFESIRDAQSDTWRHQAVRRVRRAPVQEPYGFRAAENDDVLLEYLEVDDVACRRHDSVSCAGTLRMGC